MKKLLGIIMISLIMLSLVACGEKKTVEERFMESLVTSLEAKWASEAEATEQTKESLDTQINAEIEALNEYTKAEFENSDLGNLAKQYTETLISLKDGLEKYATPEWNAMQFNNYKERSKIISDINEIMTINVSDEYKEKLSVIITDGSQSVDEWFMLSLAKGLEARWALTTANENKENPTKADWEGYFLAEDNFINQYNDATFEDKNLEKWAKEYVNSIVESKEALKYYGTNQWTAKYNNGIYQTRVSALYNINALVAVPVSEEWQAELDGVVLDGEVTDMVLNLLKKVKFKKTSDEYGWKTYECVVENTTNANFEYFAFIIDLVDKDGVTVQTESAWSDNWSAGEKNRFRFETSEKFKEMKVVSAEWYF